MWAILNREHTAAIIELINSDNDRIVAVVGGAILEESLTRTVAERFREGGTSRKLLGGVLGASRAKVDLLYVLRAIDKSQLTAIQGLIEVRNFFAHTPTAAFKSTNPKLLEGIKQLKLHEGLKRYPHHYLNDDSAGSKIEKVRTNRDKFTVNLRLALIALMRDRLRHETWSNTPRSEAVVTAEWVAQLKHDEEEGRRLWAALQSGGDNRA